MPMGSGMAHLGGDDRTGPRGPSGLGRARPATLNGPSSTLWHLVFVSRHVGLAVICLGHLAADGLDDRTGWLILLAILPYDVVSHARVAHTRRLHRDLAITDSLALILLAAAGLDFSILLLAGITVVAVAATSTPGNTALAMAGSTTAVIVALARLDDGRLEAIPAAVTFVTVTAAVAAAASLLSSDIRRSRERGRLLAQDTDALMWEEIPDRLGALAVNDAAERLLGHDRREWEVEGFWVSLLHPGDRDRVLEEVRRHFETRSDHVFTMRLRHRDGTYRSVENRVRYTDDGTGRGPRFIGVMVDRTTQVAAETDAVRFGAIVASSPIPHLLFEHVDGVWTLALLNDAGRSLLGVCCDAQDPMGKSVDEFAGGDAQVSEVVELLERSEDMQLRLPTPDGRVLEITQHVLDDTTRSVTLQDVTERARAADLAEHQALHDSLTGLPNRRLLLDRLEQELRRSTRAGGATTLMLLDLDEFKEVNDALGHAAGDELLVAVAERIVTLVRDCDTVARLGGDEFAVLLPGADRAAAADIADRVAVGLAEPYDLDDLRLHSRASIGIALHPDDAPSAGELVRRADVAMYHAKRQALGWAFYDSGHDRFSVRRVRLMGDLDAAVSGNQFVCHYQPVVSGLHGEALAVEALVRWRHPKLGLLAPAEFVELAEVSGRIRAMTRRVIENALRDRRRLAERGLALLVSANLSVRNLYEPDLLDWLGDVVTSAGLEPHDLRLEVTEGLVMDDPAVAIEVLGRLREMGFSTCLDDFGTGHSSLSRLRQLPIDSVKIDRSFVIGLAAQPTSVTLLRSVVDLLRNLDLEIVAEGVEDEGSATMLTDLGCHSLQGYHFARPLPFGELVAWLEERHRSVSRRRASADRDRPTMGATGLGQLP